MEKSVFSTFANGFLAGRVFLISSNPGWLLSMVELIPFVGKGGEGSRFFLKTGRSLN
jgi:hypothetical protein